MPIGRDTTSPQLALPADITVEATGPGGATVTYAASASDNLDPSPTFGCSPFTGSAFPLGTTVVNCAALDAVGTDPALGSFHVTVVDTTPPLLVVSGNLSVDAVNAAGAQVSYLTPAASDLVDATPTVVCQPPSGSVFPIGTTAVTCTATDDWGNAVALCDRFAGARVLYGARPWRLGDVPT
jgi:hypothetical protein